MSGFVNDCWIFVPASAFSMLHYVLSVEAYKENPAWQEYIIGRERSFVGPKNVSQGLGLPRPDFKNFSCRMIPTPSHGGELRPSAEDTQLWGLWWLVQITRVSDLRTRHGVQFGQKETTENKVVWVLEWHVVGTFRGSLPPEKSGTAATLPLCCSVIWRQRRPTVLGIKKKNSG